MQAQQLGANSVRKSCPYGILRLTVACINLSIEGSRTKRRGIFERENTRRGTGPSKGLFSSSKGTRSSKEVMGQHETQTAPFYAQTRKNETLGCALRRTPLSAPSSRERRPWLQFWIANFRRNSREARTQRANGGVRRQLERMECRGVARLRTLRCARDRDRRRCRRWPVLPCRPCIARHSSKRRRRRRRRRRAFCEAKARR